MARFLTDECVTPILAELLNQKGHDALTVRDLGLAGRATPDTAILATAIELGRIVITQNRDDFLELHQFVHRVAAAWEMPQPGTVLHSGILTVPQIAERFTSLTEAEISRFVRLHPSIANEFHSWVNGHRWRAYS